LHHRSPVFALVDQRVVEVEQERMWRLHGGSILGAISMHQNAMVELKLREGPMTLTA